MPTLTFLPDGLSLNSVKNTELFCQALTSELTNLPTPILIALQGPNKGRWRNRDVG